MDIPRLARTTLEEEYRPIFFFLPSNRRLEEED
jgi:hypothetical protein